MRLSEIMKGTFRSQEMTADVTVQNNTYSIKFFPLTGDELLESLSATDFTKPVNVLRILNNHLIDDDSNEIMPREALDIFIKQFPMVAVSAATVIYSRSFEHIEKINSGILTAKNSYASILPPVT